MNRFRLIKQLIFHEGQELFPYDDATGKPPVLKGKLTIGIGRNLTDRGLSEDETMYLLNNDITIIEMALSASHPWWINLGEARQHVMLDMCFNMGITRFNRFKRTIEFIKLGEYEAAALAMTIWI